MTDQTQMECYKLATLLSYFDAGVKLVKYSGSTAAVELYDAQVDGNDIQPTICK